MPECCKTSPILSMNKQGYITQMLGYYEDVLENVFRTGYLYDPYGDDVLENYLFHVLTDAKIQARLDDERLQRVLKDELLAFFRYILEQRLQPKDMEQRMKLFDLHLSNKIDDMDWFLSSHEVSSENFNEFCRLVSGRKWDEKDYLWVRDLQYVRNTCPALHEIAEQMGRTAGKGGETVCVRVKETGSRSRVSRSDIVGVQEGNDVLSVLPSELVYLSSPLLEPMFYVKYTDRRLQTFAHQFCSSVRPVGRSGERETVQRKGAMITCIDTSGSMFGKKERVAKSMAWELVEVARKQKRPLYLITFAVRVRCVEVTSWAPGEWYRDFLKCSFTGGTNCDAVLRKALDVLGQERFAFSDVLLVSDFEFGECDIVVRENIKEAQQCGTRFYGLSLGRHSNQFIGLLDKIWYV